MLRGREFTDAETQAGHTAGGSDRRRHIGTGVVARQRPARTADPLSQRVDRAGERPAVGRGARPRAAQRHLRPAADADRLRAVRVAVPRPT